MSINNNNSLKISIITVCYNSIETLITTIQSVASQTYKNIEYIVVDGESTDGTIKIIKDNETVISQWVSENDKGLYDAMNKGIKMATGDVIGLINSDDLFCDNQAIEKVARIFMANMELDSVYADLFYVAQNDIDKIVRKWKTGQQRSFKKGWHPAHPTLYLKKEVYQKFGLFNLDYNLAADFEIMLRFLEKNKISTYYLEESLVKMRLGGATNQSVKNIMDGNLECIRAFKENGIKINPFTYPLYRTLPKILQFFH